MEFRDATAIADYRHFTTADLRGRFLLEAVFTPGQINLTYTQYITMMVLWEWKTISAKHLGAYLYLDSGTLTPLLKKLEERGLLTRRRSSDDERSLLVEITPQGEALREKALQIPLEMQGCINLSPEEAGTLYQLLYKLLSQMK